MLTVTCSLGVLRVLVNLSLLVDYGCFIYGFARFGFCRVVLFVEVGFGCCFCGGMVALGLLRVLCYLMVA